MTRTAFTNVRIFDGTGADTYLGDVLVEGKRIVQVTRLPERVSTDDARVIDGRGRFLMPGMTEAHTHFSWNDQPSLAAIQFMPPEEHMLWCVRVAKRYLDMGWTSAIGAYGSFIALVVIGQQNKAGSLEYAMYGFAIFYALCLVLNWWFYLRDGSEIRTP